MAPRSSEITPVPLPPPSRSEPEKLPSALVAQDVPGDRTALMFWVGVFALLAFVVLGELVLSLFRF
jgi:hypothetical protein